MSGTFEFDLVVIGSGPGGHKAAIQGAKAGRRVAVVERSTAVGGECVRRGTIPSKTLRECAEHFARVRTRQDVFQFQLREELSVPALMGRLGSVVEAHGVTMGDQLKRNGVEIVHGLGRLAGSHRVDVQQVCGGRRELRARDVVIATGSRPRLPREVPIDHEHIHDSDSILSLFYLPESLIVLGGGVIACEWASIFLHLGVRVTLINRWPRPLGFLDPELSACFLREFEDAGGRYFGARDVEQVAWDGASRVVATLAGGQQVSAHQALAALGRVACLEGLGLDSVGLSPNARGYLDVDADYRTSAPHVYAVGDVIGPPSLAATAMEQGRRAVCAALDLEQGAASGPIPVGIYTLPEIGSVGLTEEQAREQHDRVWVGRARFAEIARGLIARTEAGLLKLIADDAGRVLGVQIVGDGATELIHVGQMAMVAGCTVETFVETVFNFPTYGEAYRVAALDVVNQRRTGKTRRKAG